MTAFNKRIRSMVKKRLRKAMLRILDLPREDIKPNKTSEEKIVNEVRAHFGKYSYACEGLCVASPKTRVGSYCSIALNVTLGTTQHPTSFLTTHIFPYHESYKIVKRERLLYFNFAPPVFIGNDVWIGKNAIVKDGVTIGDGAIIGSGAIVAKDVSPYAIVGGVPARVIRYRFDESTIKQLLELKWWELPEQVIRDLPFDDVPACIEVLRKWVSEGK